MTRDLMVTVVVPGAAGRVDAWQVPLAEFVVMARDHMAAARQRRHVVDRAITESARAAFNADQRGSTPTDFDGSAHEHAGAPHAVAAPWGDSTPTAPTREAPLLTYRQAAELLACSASTVKRRADNGKLTRVGSGTGVRVTRASVEAYVAGQGGA